MRPSVSLQVQAKNINHANVLNTCRQEIDFGPDQIRNRKRLLAWQDTNLNRTGFLNLVIDLGFDFFH